jgi:hypothetical protein
MLIAASVVTALLVTAAGAAPVTTLPPMVVTVWASGEVSPSLVPLILAETDAVWRSTGFVFVWRRAARGVEPYERTGEAAPYTSSTLRVVVGDETGSAADGNVPLGWITFDDETSPQREIHVSYANALRLMTRSPGVVGVVDRMPTAQREALLARALGRALAHECGHYLFASKAHSAAGLMAASHTAAEFFGIERSRFSINPAQLAQLAARVKNGLQAAPPG